MAFVEHKDCPKCEKSTRHINEQCSPCAERAYREKIAAWNALTVEEKLQDLA